MIKIIKELDVEVTKPNIFQAIVAKQYDMNTRFLKVTFKDCGTRIDIPNIETAKVVINAERKDGQSKGFDGEINEDGTVTVPLHSWMLELEGTVICDISVIDTAADDEKKLTTTSFTLLVEKAAYGGNDITSDPQYDVLVQLLGTCNEASEVAQEALEKSNEANEKYYACVEATNNANQAAENANAVRGEVEAGGFIESLKEMNKGGKFSFWVGTQAEYNALPEKVDGCFYLITDDPARNDIDSIKNDISLLTRHINKINDRQGGKLLYSSAGNQQNSISPTKVGQVVEGLSNYHVILCYVNSAVNSYYHSPVPVLMVNYNSSAQPRLYTGYATHLVDNEPSTALLNCLFDISLWANYDAVTAMGGYVQSSSDYNNIIEDIRIEMIIGIS